MNLAELKAADAESQMSSSQQKCYIFVNTNSWIRSLQCNPLFAFLFACTHICLQKCWHWFFEDFFKFIYVCQYRFRCILTQTCGPFHSSLIHTKVLNFENSSLKKRCKSFLEIESAISIRLQLEIFLICEGGWTSQTF